MEHDERNDEQVEESLAARRLAHFEPEIQEGDGQELVLAREPGFLGLCKHLWYHYKFVIITALFLVLVLAVCIGQCATRNRYDLNILYAGAWEECDVSASQSGVRQAFSAVMQDYDGDGQKNISYTSLYLLSQEQIEAIRQENAGKPPEEQFHINGALIKQNRDLLDGDIMTGEMRFCVVDSWVWAYFKQNDLLEDLTQYVSPALVPESNLGTQGIYLRDTAFGQYFGVFGDLPPDTVICVRRAGAMNQAWNSEANTAARDHYADLLNRLLTFSPTE